EGRTGNVVDRGVSADLLPAAGRLRGPGVEDALELRLRELHLLGDVAVRVDVLAGDELEDLRAESVSVRERERVERGLDEVRRRKIREPRVTRQIEVGGLVGRVELTALGDHARCRSADAIVLDGLVRGVARATVDVDDAELLSETRRVLRVRLHDGAREG